MARAVKALKAATDSQPKLPVWITHMWHRIQSKRLGLILGSGVSVDAGCPPWRDLVERIAARAPRVKTAMRRHRTAGLRDAYITQILYLLEAARIRRKPGRVPDRFRRFQIAARWQEIVFEELYKDLKSLNFSAICNKHSYLKALGELTYHSGFTVNFNFDDLVDEAAIYFAIRANLPNSEFPEIIWRPKIEACRGAPVIYHINGYLPREEGRPRSNFLTMTEDAFAEVLVSPNSPDAEFIMARFATTTFLILGTSLNDDSLGHAACWN